MLYTPSDLDLLTEDNVEIDPTRYVIRLRAGGALKEDEGVTGRLVYSYVKDVFMRTDMGQYSFPFYALAVIDEMIDLVLQHGWIIDPDGLHLLRRTFLRVGGGESDVRGSPYCYVSSDMTAIRMIR